jgi:hypothetical protein
MSVYLIVWLPDVWLFGCLVPSYQLFWFPSHLIKGGLFWGGDSLVEGTILPPSGPKAGEKDTMAQSLVPYLRMLLGVWGSVPT